MHKANFVLSTPLFLTMIGFASVSVAETTTTYPGTDCVEALDPVAEVFYEGGKAFNELDDWDATFECPIPRPDSNLAGLITDINARVDDSHPNEAVECQAFSCNPYGTSCYSSAADGSAGTGFQSLSLAQMSTFTNGYAYLRCEIPDAHNGDRSGVLSYRVTTE